MYNFDSINHHIISCHNFERLKNNSNHMLFKLLFNMLVKCCLKSNNQNILYNTLDINCNIITNIKIPRTCVNTVHCVVTQQQNTVKRDTTKRVHCAHNTAVHAAAFDQNNHCPRTEQRSSSSKLRYSIGCGYSEREMANSKIINNL